MSEQEGTSGILLREVIVGNEHAPGEIFDRYVGRLVALVRRRVSSRLSQRVDPEDIAQSAFRSFFVRAKNGEYRWRRSGDLWRLLAKISLSKLRRQVEIHTAAKRAIAQESQNDFCIENQANRLPSVEEQAALLEEVEIAMQQCSATEREVLQLRLAGEGIESIANSINRSQRTVRRILKVCRETFEQRLLEK